MVVTETEILVEELLVPGPWPTLESPAEVPYLLMASCVSLPKRVLQLPDLSALELRDEFDVPRINGPGVTLNL